MIKLPAYAGQDFLQRILEPEPQTLNLQGQDYLCPILESSRCTGLERTRSNPKKTFLPLHRVFVKIAQTVTL